MPLQRLSIVLAIVLGLPLACFIAWRFILREHLYYSISVPTPEGNRVDVAVTLSRRYFIGNHVFGWGGGERSEIQIGEGRPAWRMPGRWEPVFVYSENPASLFIVRQIPETHPKFKAFRWTDNSWAEADKNSIVELSHENLKCYAYPFFTDPNASESSRILQDLVSYF